MDKQSSWKSELLSKQIEGLNINDSTKETILSSLIGKITFWSDPDSSGSQYKLTEVDFQKQEVSDKNNIRNINQESQTTIHQGASGDSIDNSSVKDTIQTDSRFINGELISTILGLGLLAFLIGIIIKEYKRGTI